MKTVSVLPHSYTSPEIETQIDVFEHDIMHFAKIHAQEDHQIELSRGHFNIKVVERVRSLTQIEIDRIKSILQVPSLVTTTLEKEQLAKDKKQRMITEITDKSVEYSVLERQHDVIKIDDTKRKYGKLLHPVAILCGIGDGVLAYLAFILAYSPLMAIISALGIGLSIAVSHIPYTPWVMKVTSAKARVLRSLAVLSGAFFLFAVLSNLRASAMNQTGPDLGVNSNIVSAAVINHVNGWAVCLISFTLFVVVFFLALTLYRSQEERQAEALKQKLFEEMEKTKREIEMLKSEIIEIDAEVIDQKSLARMIHNYASSSISRCKSIAESAINLFKNDYIRYHKTAPEYFSEYTELALDSNLNYNKKNEES